MFILYPTDYFNKKLPDESFIDETTETKKLLSIGTFFSAPAEGETVVYRGWMLSGDEYDEISEFCKKKGLNLLTDKETYYNAHHIDNWYERVKGLTPETLIFKDKESLLSAVEKSDWPAFFIKDSVKSLTTSRGSIANSKDEVSEIVAELEDKKGIEGSLVIRKVHNFLSDSEVRYFSIKGKLQSPSGHSSAIAEKVSTMFSEMPFISIDIIKDADGQEWLVEIGDGQVSDMKMWEPAEFAQMLSKIQA